MSKETATSKKPSSNGSNGTAKEAKTKANYKKRTHVDLKKTQKGKIVLILQSCVILANKNERKDIVDGNKTHSLALDAKENTEKGLRGKIYKISREGKAIDLMDEKSPEYAKLLSLAKAAKDEAVQSKYGENVIALLNHAITEIGGSSKGFNPSVLADIEL